MTLWDQVSDDTSIFLNTSDLAESVTYTPKDGSKTTVTALIERGEMDPQMTDVADTEIWRATLHVAKSDVTDPHREDQFSFERRRGSGQDTTWVVAGWQSAGAMWTIQVLDIDRLDEGQAAYRLEGGV